MKIKNEYMKSAYADIKDFQKVYVSSISNILEVKIKTHLNFIFQEILALATHPISKDLLEKTSYFAGGCIRSLISDTAINDYDIYFYDYKSASQLKEYLLHDQLKYNQKLFNWNKLLSVSVTDNAMTYKYYSDSQNKFVTIQFIIKYAAEPLDLIKNFDFTNSKGYFIPNSKSRPETLFISDEMINAIKEKKLFFNKNCWNPINSLKRMIKFIELGYKIDDYNLLMLIEAIKKSNENQLNSFKIKSY